MEEPKTADHGPHINWRGSESLAGILLSARPKAEGGGGRPSATMEIPVGPCSPPARLPDQIGAGESTLRIGRSKADYRRCDPRLDAWSRAERLGAVKRAIKMLKDLIAKAKKEGFKLIPVVGIACPGIIEAERSSEKVAPLVTQFKQPEKRDAYAEMPAPQSRRK